MKTQFTFILLMVICLKASIMRCQNVICNSSDLRALISFSSSLESVIGGWNISSFNCCTWTGITCDKSTSSSKRVVRLELSCRRLAGAINESLADLDQLRILNLSQNLLHGHLPGKIFHLQNLEILDLSKNDFSGPIPGGIHLPSIWYVDMSINSFNGSFNATALCLISPHVHVLNLANNYLADDVSTSVGRCSSLQHLYINGNNFRGTFPKSLLQLRHLRTLHLQDNLFFGSLIDEIGYLSHLVELDISSNKFSGILPDVFGRFKKLENFFASSNKFSGRLPMSLVNSPHISTLKLNNNTLDGPINLNCSAMIQLTTVNLGSNNFYGPIPDSISSCRRLMNLNLARNKLGGEVPFAFKNLHALRSLSLSNTSLVNISTALQNLQHCRNLTSLFLGINFQGEEMPGDINFHFRNLKVLVIPRCGLSGSIPSWLRSIKKLQLLDLAWNRLSGTIPFWLQESKYLFYMDLSNNSFTGQIPKSLTELQSLVSMNISAEELSTGFPIFWGLENGVRYEYKHIMGFRPTLDLSYNELTGPISPGFGNLKDLHVLNLKENHLAGKIPDSLSGMTNLEVLDLSYNKLSGEIPLSLEKLSFLSKFNVAHNQLNGEIPTGGQFMTFPASSFEGNKGLYGAHLPSCQPQPAPNDQPDEKEMTIVDLQFGLGVMTGFLFTVAFCFISGWVFPKTTTNRI